MKYQTVKCSERLPNEGGLFFTITNKGKHAATIYVGGDMWAIGLTDEKIEYWLEPIESDTQCMDAEEWLDKLCIEIESALNDAKMKFVIENDEGHSLSLVDFLSVDGKTIEQGKEEISNIVEQIYFHLSNTQFASQHKTQIPSEDEDMREYHNSLRLIDAKIAQSIDSALRLISVFYNVKVEDIEEEFKGLIEGSITDVVSFASSPSGGNENESGKYFKEIWVDQWTIGESCDSYAGYIYAKFYKDLWLKIPYEC